MPLDSFPTMTVWSIKMKGNVTEKVRVPQHELSNKAVHCVSNLWIVFLLGYKRFDTHFEHW
jgi:hypothetical protein